jgi:hypothetical protein
VKTPVVGEIDTFPGMSSVAELVRQQARAVGFDLKVSIMPMAEVFDSKRIHAGSIPRLIMSTSLDNRMFDAYRPLDTFFGKDAFVADYGYVPRPANQKARESYLGADDAAARDAASLRAALPAAARAHPDARHVPLHAASRARRRPRRALRLDD